MTEEQKKLLAVAMQGDGRIAQVAEWDGQIRPAAQEAGECEANGWLIYIGLRDAVEAGGTPPHHWTRVPPLHTWKITDAGRVAYQAVA